jgi:hypothetical protein
VRPSSGTRQPRRWRLSRASSLETDRDRSPLAASERTALQARIGTLRTCLSGVNRVLTLTAFDDHGGALRALAAVAPSCEAAGDPR